MLDHGDASGSFHPLAQDEDVDRAALTFLWDDVVFEDLEKVATTSAISRRSSSIWPTPPIATSRSPSRRRKRSPSIQLISAQSYYRHYHFAAAADRCLRIVERWPRLEMANTCGNIILHVFSATDQLEPLEHYARALSENRAAMSIHTDLAATVEETLHYAGVPKRVAAWSRPPTGPAARRRSGSSSKRPHASAAIRDEFPSSPHADKALFNALAQYVNLGVRERAHRRDSDRRGLSAVAGRPRRAEGTRDARALIGRSRQSTVDSRQFGSGQATPRV